jgi:recombination protein RecR
MLKIEALERLIFELGKLPGVGPKSAQRMAYSILRNSSLSKDLRHALDLVEQKVHLCPQCFSYTDRSVCRYCEDPLRTDDVICVVEQPSDIQHVEGSGVFKGRYHVLHGAISPLDGIRPESLRIKELLDRVRDGLNGHGPQVQEIIMAVDADLEGDTTVLYLAQQLKGQPVRLTRLAQGVPMGGHIDYIDDRTLGRALENRTELTWR